MMKRLDIYLFSATGIHAGLIIFFAEMASLRGAHVEGEIAQLAGIMFIIGAIAALIKLFYIPQIAEYPSYAKLMVYLLIASVIPVFILHHTHLKLTSIYGLVIPFVIALYAKIKDFDKKEE